MYTVVLLTVLTLSFVTGNSLIEPELNPGCKTCLANETILVYAKAEDDNFNYTIHQVWDFTGHVPIMMFVIGNKNSTLNIDWDGNKPNGIKTNNTFYSFGLLIKNLIEYNDTDDDTASFDYSYPHREISLRDVTWRLDRKILSNVTAEIRVRGDLSWAKHRMNGTIDIKLVLIPFAGRWRSLPRLYHSVNTTQVDVSLVGLTVSPKYTSGRFALRYVFASEDRADTKLQYAVHRSIDDEYTPGVFETMNFITPASARGLSGFVQYRPVAYTERERDVENSVTAYVRDYNTTKIPHNCLMEKYYSKFDRDNVLIEELVASFGQSGDGFYKKTNYTVWTYTVGYGIPPAENASVFLIVMLILGIVTPIVAVIGSVIVSKRMMRRHRESLLEQEEA